jgi:hypothetical protein
MSDFAEKVSTVGSAVYIGITDEGKMDKWKSAYNLARRLEEESLDKIFLFSAQHKDCVILATVLTALSKKEQIIWRTDDVNETKIDIKETRERDANAVNMSASLSLLDWNICESANSFLINSSISNVNNGACQRLLQTIREPLIWNIIRSYYDKLETRYLCLFKFDETQLNAYVRLSKSWGEMVSDSITDMKSKIEEIKEEYVTNCLDAHDYRYQYSQEIQARILTTTSLSENPYETIILEPKVDGPYSLMRKEIIKVVESMSAQALNPAPKGGHKLTRRKRSTRNRSKHRRR